MKKALIALAIAGSLTACHDDTPEPDWTIQPLPSVNATKQPITPHVNDFAPPSPSAKPSPRVTKKASRSRHVVAATDTSSVGGLQGRIADCESGERTGSGRAVPGSRRYHTIHYPSGKSSASGAYGFLDGTWHEVTGRSDRAYQAPASVQDAAYRKLYSTSGTAPWEASRSCWG